MSKLRFVIRYFIPFISILILGFLMAGSTPASLPESNLAIPSDQTFATSDGVEVSGNAEADEDLQLVSQEATAPLPVGDEILITDFDQGIMQFEFITEPLGGDLIRPASDQDRNFVVDPDYQDRGNMLKMDYENKGKWVGKIFILKERIMIPEGAKFLVLEIRGIPETGSDFPPSQIKAELNQGRDIIWSGYTPGGFGEKWKKVYLPLIDLPEGENAWFDEVGIIMEGWKKSESGVIYIDKIGFSKVEQLSEVNQEATAPLPVEAEILITDFDQGAVQFEFIANPEGGDLIKPASDQDRNFVVDSDYQDRGNMLKMDYESKGKWVGKVFILKERVTITEGAKFLVFEMRGIPEAGPDFPPLQIKAELKQGQDIIWSGYTPGGFGEKWKKIYLPLTDLPEGEDGWFDEVGIIMEGQNKSESGVIYIDKIGFSMSEPLSNVSQETVNLDLVGGEILITDFDQGTLQFEFIANPEGGDLIRPASDQDRNFVEDTNYQDRGNMLKMDYESNGKWVGKIFILKERVTIPDGAKFLVFEMRGIPETGSDFPALQIKAELKQDPDVIWSGYTPGGFGEKWKKIYLPLTDLPEGEDGWFDAMGIIMEGQNKSESGVIYIDKIAFSSERP